MTTLWKIEPILAGQTVAVLASGPSLTPEVVAALRKFGCIVVNYSFLMAPDAMMMVALDSDAYFWKDAEAFQGMRVCGVDTDLVDALYAGPMYERIVVGPNHTVETRNSGLAAIRIAARMGATRIILAGFDPDSPGHFDGRPADDGVTSYPFLAEGLAGIIAELGAQGIVVEYFAPASNVVATPVDGDTVTGDGSGQALPPAVGDPVAADPQPTKRAKAA